MKSLLNRWKGCRPFKEFYTEWINTLKSTLLPLLSRTLSSPSPDLLLLSTHLDLLHSHFITYFTALDYCASSTQPQPHNDVVSQLLFPEWRTPLEKPFLWLGDFHPYIFTNLLRSFLDDQPATGIEIHHAWLNAQDSSLWHYVEQMERGLRLMVPSIAARHRDAQAALVAHLASKDLKVGLLLGDVTDELTRVFLDANRLRTSVLGDIMAALNLRQRALFLQALAQFYVGFWDAKLLADFKKSHLTLD